MAILRSAAFFEKKLNFWGFWLERRESEQTLIRLRPSKNGQY